MATQLKKAVLELRPTQFVLGIKEVEHRVKKLEGFSHAELKDYLEEHVVPCVLGPSGHTYLIDHHHFVHACWQARVDEVLYEIVADKQHLSTDEFWQFMKKSNWVYLNDQFGNGPHDPSQLPVDIRSLSDDPYRSLAWELREAGVIEKVQVPFSEFKWAAFLRKALKFDLHEQDWKQVVHHAVTLVSAEIKKGTRTPAVAGDVK